MQNMIRKILILALVLVTALGCGGDPGPNAVVEEVVPASGTLTYQGKPLPFFQISLTPTDGRRAAVGVTDEAGKFSLGTNAAGDGAPPGTHKLAVVWVGPPQEDDAGQAVIDDPSLLPKPSVKLPAKYASPDESGLTQTIPDGGTTSLQIDLK
jgi:hypothetical protein